MTGPPRLLLGASLLFWGGMTERAVPGLACALLIEGAHWTRVRWNFSERAFLMAWRLCVLFLLLAMVLVVLQGARHNAMAKVFSWLPVILLPLQFVQSYGMSRTTTLGTFSMLVRRRRDHALKHGLPFREVRFSFGHVFFCAALLASCLGELADSPAFFAGLLILISWAVVAARGRGWRGLTVATACALILAALGGWGGQQGLNALYRYVTSGGSSGDGNPGMQEHQTSIGSLGEIKQSPEIRWRLIPEQGRFPMLLRVASYDTYFSGKWLFNELPPGAKGFHDDFKAVGTLPNPANPADPNDQFFIAPPDLGEATGTAIDPALPRFRLRGVVPRGRDNFGLLPLPANAAALHQFANEDFHRNSLGTFRVKPSQPVSDARVLWGGGFATEKPPWEKKAPPRLVNDQPVRIQPGLATPKREAAMLTDLEIPKREAAMLKEVAAEIGLHEAATPEEKIALLQAHFLGNFRYTRYNSVPRDLEEWARRDRKVRGYVEAEDPTLLGTFLQFTKAGHCEFYASASALLLREAGVPTRYVSGFAVMEVDRETGEALVRGTHAHAWCRAWDEAAKRWIDVDLTPPDWASFETPRHSRLQALGDWIQLKREDLLVWRDRPGNMTIITAVLLSPILIGLAFIGRNLWRSRSRLDLERSRRHGVLTLPATPLTALEKPARKWLGDRPPGMPLAPWLGQLAPRLPQPELLAEAMKLHHRLRFDPAAAEGELLPELQRLVAGLRRDLAGRGA